MSAQTIAASGSGGGPPRKPKNNDNGSVGRGCWRCGDRFHNDIPCRRKCRRCGTNGHIGLPCDKDFAPIDNNKGGPQPEHIPPIQPQLELSLSDEVPTNLLPSEQVRLLREQVLGLRQQLAQAEDNTRRAELWARKQEDAVYEAKGRRAEWERWGVAMERQVDELRDQNYNLQQENINLQQEVINLQEQNARLNQQNNELAQMHEEDDLAIENFLDMTDKHVHELLELRQFKRDHS